ncbi:hypothetical protein [Alicyclobacillus fodiniaquatilis]|uniref:Uncharacterized protein n=1 Tax=Alicyclobacillus fodiniaquatilis TaxID=1661150 RepID=A0ABW4JGF9_9BACL
MTAEGSDLKRDRSGNPLPQDYVPDESQFEPLTGEDFGSGHVGQDTGIWGKTASGIWLPIKISTDGYPLVDIANIEIILPTSITTIGRKKIVGLSGNPMSASDTAQFPSESGVECTGYSYVRGSIMTDQAGTLTIQHCEDGASWEDGTVITVNANEICTFNEMLYGSYVALEYANGATAQTSFVFAAFLAPM